MQTFVATIVGGLTVALAATGMCAGPLTATDVKGSWELAEVNGRPVPRTATNALPMFTIKDQTIDGFDGCNKFWGRLDKPGSIASTRRGCSDEAVKLPLDLTDPMSHLQSAAIQGDKLVLPARNGIPPSVFRRGTARAE